MRGYQLHRLLCPQLTLIARGGALQIKCANGYAPATDVTQTYTCTYGQLQASSPAITCNKLCTGVTCSDYEYTVGGIAVKYQPRSGLTGTETCTTVSGKEDCTTACCAPQCATPPTPLPDNVVAGACALSGSNPLTNGATCKTSCAPSYTPAAVCGNALSVSQIVDRSPDNGPGK
jgi:hypothetical protein